MAIFKVSFICNAGKRGFSETWYFEHGDLTTALANAEPVAVERDKLMGVGAQIEAVRVSTVPPAPRQGKLRSYEQIGGIGGRITPTPANIADAAGAAILCMATSTEGHRRQVWLRAAADAWIQRDVNNPGVLPLTHPQLRKFWQGFKDIALGLGGKINPQMRLQVYQKEAPVDAPRKILGVSKNAVTGFYELVTQGPYTFVEGDKVVIRGLRGVNVSAALGVSTVFSAINATTFTIGGKYPIGTIGIAYEGGGTVQKREFKYVPLLDLELLRVAHRQTGRAFFVPRGRQSPKKP